MHIQVPIDEHDAVATQLVFRVTGRAFNRATINIIYLSDGLMHTLCKDDGVIEGCRM